MLNRYTYCRNNPLIYVDPTGNYSQDGEADAIMGHAAEMGYGGGATAAGSAGNGGTAGLGPMTTQMEALCDALGIAHNPGYDVPFLGILLGPLATVFQGIGQFFSGDYGQGLATIGGGLAAFGVIMAIDAMNILVANTAGRALAFMSVFEQTYAKFNSGEKLGAMYTLTRGLFLCSTFLYYGPSTGPFYGRGEGQYSINLPSSLFLNPASNRHDESGNHFGWVNDVLSARGGIPLGLYGEAVRAVGIPAFVLFGIGQELTKGE